MAEQIINIVEIKNLKQLLVKNPNASIPLYNPDSGKVERILVADLVGGETVKVPWVIDQNYMIDDIAEFNNKIWKSLQDNNVGHQPYDDQTWWIEVSASSANGTALQPWAAGIFNIVNSSVTVNNVGYLLNNNVTLPFNSTDFATELASNIWLPLGSSGASTAANVITTPTATLLSTNQDATNAELDLKKSSKRILDSTAWNTAATTFTLDWLKRYDFGATACITSVTWSFTTPTDNEDYEYWFKLKIGTGGTSHTFTGCTFAPNNDTLAINSVYEFSIKRGVVYIRKDG